MVITMTLSWDYWSHAPCLISAQLWVFTYAPVGAWLLVWPLTGYHESRFPVRDLAGCEIEHQGLDSKQPSEL